MSNYQNVLNNFLEQWPLDKVEKMSLEQYVSTGDPTTFTQWIENRTIKLGTISGPFGSRMFGIYKRRKPDPLKGYINDELFTWDKKYGNDRNLAFSQVKEHILDTIKFSSIGEFSKIDQIPLPNIFKWKVAYLYSNERLIPIFKMELLKNIAIHYGLAVTRKTTISEIQKILIKNKPIELNPHDFMHVLCDKFIPKKQNTDGSLKPITPKNAVKKSKGTQQEKNTNDQERITTPSYIAKQTHNKIQNKLRRILIDEHGEHNVECEKNYVDLTLYQKDCITLYEVKSDAYAATCIRQALGQIIQYAHRLDTNQKIKLYVVGQYPLEENEIPYLSYIQENLKIDLDYISIDLD
ncbi:hypothetical protein F994_02417 [Acinetobacter bohemicus ANC 3994]|uniref:Protein NO VEIN C-terminal domain-containing protein n=1 Tax=Acinetobacter bohemicus ANC 3994 TaxID=1217715 RepID=N8QCI0_9GAMM|nr:hypothetical protein [Acinetobacter bohemicus]ENU19557.1 hypothetical protein F994_02417 [Acinetobacter bohemicus ANC 3994]